MKVSMFHLMPHRELPDDFERRYKSVWVDPPWHDLADPVRVGHYYICSLEELSYAAQALNDVIAKLDLLGPQYEVGHTYFMDIVPILKSATYSSRQSVFLWSRGEAQSPAEALTNFWELSLSALLNEYLAGFDQPTREEYLARMREAFMTKP